MRTTADFLATIAESKARTAAIVARREREDALDRAWYAAGWYDVLGYDRHGRSYTTHSSKEDDQMFEANRTDGVMYEKGKVQS